MQAGVREERKGERTGTVGNASLSSLALKGGRETTIAKHVKRGYS